MSKSNIILFIFISHLTFCKKDAQIKQAISVTEKSNWLKLTTSPSLDLNIKNAFVKNNFAYFIADGAFVKMDSNQNIISSTPIFQKMEMGFIFRPTYNDKYIVQVNYGRHSLLVYDIENPQINNLIQLDTLTNMSSYLRAFGQLNEMNELLLSNPSVFGKYPNSMNKLTFYTQNSSIKFINSYYFLDTVSVYQPPISRIFSNKTSHYVTPNDNWTLRLENGDFNSIGAFRMTNLINIHDTLYAPIFPDNTNGQGLFISINNGLSWQRLIEGLRLDYYYFYPIDNYLILSFYNHIFKLTFDFLKNTWTFSELSHSGLLENTSNSDEVTKVFVLGDKIYAATSKGVYYKKLSDL